MKIEENIKAIRLSKSIKQQVIADALDLDVAVVSNIEKGKRELKVSELEIIANALGVSVVDLIVYPKVYVEERPTAKSDVDVVVQIKLDKDRRDEVLKMLSLDDKLQILNK